MSDLQRDTTTTNAAIAAIDALVIALGGYLLTADDDGLRVYAGIRESEHPEFAGFHANSTLRPGCSRAQQDGWVHHARDWWRETGLADPAPALPAPRNADGTLTPVAVHSDPFRP